MKKSVLAADAFGVTVGAVAGTLVNSVAVSLIVGAPYADLVTSWGKYIVAIATVATFVWFYHKTPKTVAAILSLLSGILIPSILAKGVFGAGAGWGTVFFLNAVFAVVALLVYRSIRNAIVGSAAPAGE